MQCHSPVETEYKEVQVVTQTGTGTQSNLFREILQRQLSIRTVFILTHQPDITCIEKNSSVQVAENTEAVFHVCFHTDIAHVVDIGILFLFIGWIATGPDTAGRIGTDTVGATNIELFGIRRSRCISVGPDYSSCNTGSNHLVLVYPVVIAEFRIQLQELCERYSQQFLVFLAERLSECLINQRGQITGRSECSLPPDGITYIAKRSVIIGVGIFHLGNKLITETDVKSRVLSLYFFKSRSRIAQHIKCQLEGRDTMFPGRHRLKVIRDVSTESKQFVVLGTVHLVYVDTEGGGSREVIFLGTHPGEDDTWEGKCRR